MFESIIKFEKLIVKITLLLFLLSTSLKIAHQLTHVFEKHEKTINYDENHDETHDETHCKICDEINAIIQISSALFYALIFVTFKYNSIRFSFTTSHFYNRFLLQLKTRGPPQIKIAS